MRTRLLLPLILSLAAGALAAAPAQARVPLGTYRCVRPVDQVLPGFRLQRGAVYTADFGSAGVESGRWRARGSRFAFLSGPFKVFTYGRIARKKGKVVIVIKHHGYPAETCSRH